MRKIHLLFLGLFLAGCGLETYHGGDLPPRQYLDTVKVGDSQDKVLRVLGSPAIESTIFSDGTRYLIYAQNIKESRVFLEPEEVQRDVHVFVFDRQGRLTERRYLTLADAATVPFDSDKTSVGGQEQSLWQQLIQNFGRYNAGAQDSSVRR